LENWWHIQKSSIMIVFGTIFLQGKLLSQNCLIIF